MNIKFKIIVFSLLLSQAVYAGPCPKGQYDDSQLAIKSIKCSKDQESVTESVYNSDCWIGKCIPNPFEIITNDKFNYRTNSAVTRWETKCGGELVFMDDNTVDQTGTCISKFDWKGKKPRTKPKPPSQDPFIGSKCHSLWLNDDSNCLQGCNDWAFDTVSNVWLLCVIDRWMYLEPPKDAILGWPYKYANGTVHEHP